MRKLLYLVLMIGVFTQMRANELVWDAPTTLSSMGVDASNPQIVMDPGGNLTVIWEEGGFVKANSLAFGGAWGTTQTLSGSGASSPKIGVDANGVVTAIWVENGVIQTAAAASLGMWGSASSLSGSGASEPVLSINEHGDAVAVWTRGGFIEAETKLVSGSWSIVSVLSGANSNHPDVSVGKNGTVLAVWHTIESGADICKSSSQSAIGGVWTTPKNIVQITPSFAFDYPKVAVDPNGNAAGLAFRYQVVNGNYINVVLYASELPKNAPAWKALPTALSGPGLRDPADLVAKISFDAVGNAMAVWTMSFDSQSFAVETSMKFLGGDWTPKFQLVEPDLYSFSADISANALGDVVGVYSFYDGADLTIQSAEANITGINSEIFWSSPIQITTEAGNAYPKLTSVYTNPDVFAGAAWISFDGANKIVQAAFGSRQTIDPPTDLAVVQDTVDFGAYIDYFNTITWNPSPNPNVVEYEIFRNGSFFARVGPGTFEAEDHNVDPVQNVTYGVCAVDDQLTQSPIVYINFP